MSKYFGDVLDEEGQVARALRIGLNVEDGAEVGPGLEDVDLDGLPELAGVNHRVIVHGAHAIDEPAALEVQL
jgi:hypothetical protein